MLNIHLSEILLIFFLVILLVKPKDIPYLLNKTSFFIKQIRNIIFLLQKQIDDLSEEDFFEKKSREQKKRTKKNEILDEE